MQFSLFFFAADDERATDDKYRLVVEAAKFADAHGFEAVWTPERHYHAFGGLYPNPSVMSAALAMVTARVKLRGGSVVAPLHHPVRIAEEWALVDNLSQGRVGVALASGWQPNDFVVCPEAFAQRKQRTQDAVGWLRRLWRGEPFEGTNGAGEPCSVHVFPRPKQRELPLWLTSAGSRDTFELAGRLGLNVLTHLLGQDLAELGAKIAAYRAAYRAAGHAGQGHVTLMLHTFVGDDADRVRQIVHDPFCAYLRRSGELMLQMANSIGVHNAGEITAELADEIVEMAFRRYYETAGLFGTPSSLLPWLFKLRELGIDELASLIDFGVDPEVVLQSLASLVELKTLYAEELTAQEYSIAKLAAAHQPSHFQCTPSLMRAQMDDPEAMAALRSVRLLMLGGEALPHIMAERLSRELPARLLNMYGPTETTVWSTTHEITSRDLHGPIPIGRPIANTQCYVLDEEMELLPAGVPGELWIGGEGVSQGYLHRAEETSKRYRDNPFGPGLLYRTGDLARFRADGVLEFVGRADQQVKLNGFRVELPEIEAVMLEHALVSECAVAAQPSADGTHLLAGYFVRDPESEPPSTLVRQHAAARIQAWASYYDSLSDDAVPLPLDRPNTPLPARASAQRRARMLEVVQRLGTSAPVRVLELGAGDGVLALQLLPSATAYLAVDGVESSLARLATMAGPLAERLATTTGDLTGAELSLPTGFDLVILRATADLPSLGALERLLVQGLRCLNANGRLIVLGIRHLGARAAAHADAQLRIAPPLLSRLELLDRATSGAAQDDELWIAPSYFLSLAERNPDIAAVRIELARVEDEDDPDVFRYDVLLERSNPLPTRALPERAWTRDFADPAELRRELAAALATGLYVRGVPNPSAQRAFQLLAWLGDPQGPASEWEINKRLWELEPDGVAPQQAAQLGQGLELRPQDDGWHYDLILHPSNGRPCLSQQRERNANMASAPLSTKLGDHLADALRSQLRARLPDYMVPSVFLELSQMPRTANGKLDRRSLPRIDLNRVQRRVDYVVPRTPLESTLATIWQQVLGVERCGIYDDFFELGGTSLKALQLVTRVQDELGVRVPVRGLFDEPNVAALARVLAPLLEKKHSDTNLRPLPTAPTTAIASNA